MYSQTVGRPVQTLLIPEKKILAQFKVHLQFCSEAKELVITLEKRTISYLSVLAWIRVIAPFSKIKQENNSLRILDDEESGNRINFGQSQIFT